MGFSYIFSVGVALPLMGTIFGKQLSAAYCPVYIHSPTVKKPS